MLNPYQNLLMNYPTGDSELERFRRAQQNAQMMAAKQLATSVPQPQPEPPAAVLSEEQKRLLSGGVRTPMPAVSDFAETNPPAPPSPPPAAAAVPAQPAQGAGGPVPFQPQLEYPAATLDKGPSTKANMQATRPNNMDAGQQRGYEGGQPVQKQMAEPQDIVPAAIDNVQRDPSFLDKARSWMDQLGSYFDPAGQGGDPQALHPAYGVPNAQVWEAQRGVLFNAGIMLMAAGMPNSPENRAAIIASMGNALNQTADQVIKVASASTAGGGKMSNWYRMYTEAGGVQGTGMSFNDWMMRQRNASNPSVTQPGATLRETLEKKQADLFKDQLAEADRLSGVAGDINRLGELYQVAPSGKIFGSIEEMTRLTPEGQEAMAIITRIAPQFRVEGSGSTSDLEYAGMLNSLGKLSNSREGNAAIIQAFNNYIRVKNERADVIRQFMQGGTTYDELQTKLMELNRRSILPDALRGQIAMPRSREEAERMVQPFSSIDYNEVDAIVGM